MGKRMQVASIEFTRTGKRSKTARLETVARKQVRAIKYATAK